MAYIVNNGTDISSEYAGQQPTGSEGGWSIGRFAFMASPDEADDFVGRYLHHADGGWPICVSDWAVGEYGEELVAALSAANAEDENYNAGLAAVEKWREATDQPA